MKVLRDEIPPIFSFLMCSPTNASLEWLRPVRIPIELCNKLQKERRAHPLRTNRILSIKRTECSTRKSLVTGFSIDADHLDLKWTESCEKSFLVDRWEEVRTETNQRCWSMMKPLVSKGLPVKEQLKDLLFVERWVFDTLLAGVVSVVVLSLWLTLVTSTTLTTRIISM